MMMIVLPTNKDRHSACPRESPFFKTLFFHANLPPLTFSTTFLHSAYLSEPKVLDDRGDLFWFTVVKAEDGALSALAARR